MTPANEQDFQRAKTVSNVTRFRLFWREVEKVKARAATGRLDATEARTTLLAVLREQEIELAKSGRASASDGYHKAQYVMAAMADDALIRLEWIGSHDWMMDPLETNLFGSRCAGELVFDRIEQLIGGTDPDGRELAEVYLAALALGFEGKYAGLRDKTNEIDEYRRRLRTFVFGDGECLTGPLVPQCYEATMAVGRGRLLCGARVWWWVAAAVVGIWLIVSSLLWRELTAPAGAPGTGRAEIALNGAPR